MRMLLLLTLVSVTGAMERSPRAKWRQELKSVLYLYSRGHQDGPQGRQAETDRQCGGSTGIVCCDNSDNVGLSCLSDITAMFSNIETVMTYRISQLDNYEMKYKRLIMFMRLIQSKGSKHESFLTVSKLLVSVLGGDINNASCPGLDPSNIPSSRSLKASLDTYNILMNCSPDIRAYCNVPLEVVSPEQLGFWKICDDLRKEIVDKTMDCAETDEGNSKCICWEVANDLVTRFKADKCLDSIIKPVASVSKTIKNACLQAFTTCKGQEDDALFLVNACDHKAVPIAGNSRSMANFDEDYWGDDYDMDFDSDFDFDY